MKRPCQRVWFAESEAANQMRAAALLRLMQMNGIWSRSSPCQQKMASMPEAIRPVVVNHMKPGHTLQSRRDLCLCTGEHVDVIPNCSLLLSKSMSIVPSGHYGNCAVGYPRTVARSKIMRNMRTDLAVP